MQLFTTFTTIKLKMPSFCLNIFLLLLLAATSEIGKYRKKTVRAKVCANVFSRMLPQSQPIDSHDALNDENKFFSINKNIQIEEAAIYCSMYVYLFNSERENFLFCLLILSAISVILEAHTPKEK